MAYTDQRGSRRTRRGVGSLLLLALFLAGALVATAYVAYVLWPRWPGVMVAPDAPALPITVAGVTFNVPPAAFRVAVQRRPGAQGRLDLVFLWPSLAAPPPAGKPAAPVTPKEAAQKPTDRLFVTIRPANNTLAPIERFKTIYPRYTESQPAVGPNGMAVVAFRNDTPYRGEQLIYDAAAPEKFLARCTMYDRLPTRGTCLAERRIGAADITIRFPRDWLSDWRGVAQGVDKLIANLRPFSG